MIKEVSKSEKKVYDLVVKGMSNVEVGEELGIQEKTVKFHMTNLFKKLSVKSRSKMIANHYVGLMKRGK